MAEHRVHRRQTAAQHGMIHGIVVNQRGQVHQLDDGGDRDRFVARALIHVAGEQHERRPEQLG